MKKYFKISIILCSFVLFFPFFFNQIVYSQTTTPKRSAWSEIEMLYSQAKTNADYQKVFQKVLNYRSKYIQDKSSIEYLRATFFLGYLKDQSYQRTSAKTFYSNCLRHPKINSSDAVYEQITINTFVLVRIENINKFAENSKTASSKKYPRISVKGGSKGDKLKPLPKLSNISLN